MITKEILEIHDDLESKTTARPWATVIRRRAGYGPLVFWSRRPDLECVFNNAHDARYLTFIRNISPEMVKEIRALRNKVAELESKLLELSKGEKNDS
jgi:hypothetical protein